jgi:hypothetical protein
MLRELNHPYNFYITYVSFILVALYQLKYDSYNAVCIQSTIFLVCDSV